MSESSLIHGCATLIGSLATVAIILTAFGIMLDIVKRTDTLKHIGTIMSFVIVMIFTRGILVNFWLDMSL